MRWIVGCDRSSDVFIFLWGNLWKHFTWRWKSKCTLCPHQAHWAHLRRYKQTLTLGRSDTSYFSLPLFVPSALVTHPTPISTNLLLWRHAGGELMEVSPKQDVTRRGRRDRLREQTTAQHEDGGGGGWRLLCRLLRKKKQFKDFFSCCLLLCSCTRWQAQRHGVKTCWKNN